MSLEKWGAKTGVKVQFRNWCHLRRPCSPRVKFVAIARAISLRAFYWYTVYPKKYAHGFCFAVLCCGYTLTDFPISIRLTSLALWQSNDCPSASKATLMNMDKYFIWIHNERFHNHNKAKHNKTVYIFLGIYCSLFISNASLNNYKQSILGINHSFIP